MFESLLVITLRSLLCTGLFPWINMSSLLSQLPDSVFCRLFVFAYQPFRISQHVILLHRLQF